ncbi:single stranded DNA-binding protein [Evansella vedderi]|uniref:Single-stranded DNA-binding protein n=1 Tax=Evansella vedderi TaxID=38282 RepID=A0ABT9ZTI3_9BACI|nr:single-stranded DNA-binding protein [Evansella vedderi]MDQ0254548.1 single stranded DNA-binding protein [Evansella vedderi]
MLNQIMLIGRIVKDPIISNTKDGRAFTRITLAVRRSFKNQEGNYDTDFISCVAWRKTAEMSSDYCTKGSLVCITGRVQMRSQEIEDNKRLSFPEIIAENITFLQLKRNAQPSDEIPIPGEEPRVMNGPYSNQGAVNGNGRVVNQGAANGSGFVSNGNGTVSNQGASNGNGAVSNQSHVNGSGVASNSGVAAPTVSSGTSNASTTNLSGKPAEANDASDLPF